MAEIKAIETSYKGYRFRSRLEARWAVFFDAAGIPYEYELQGFEVPSVCGDPESWAYLPDFYLPRSKTWVEVKGSLDDVTDEYLEMVACAVDWGGALPDVASSTGSSRGLLWLGAIPEVPADGSVPGHVILQHNKGGWCRATFFKDGQGAHRSFELPPPFTADYFDASWGSPTVAEAIRPILAGVVYGGKDKMTFEGVESGKRIRDAYLAARSARFEHGESGARSR